MVHSCLTGDFMHKIYVLLFFGAIIICALVLQEVGKDSAISSTRKVEARKPLAPGFLEESASPGREFDPALLAEDMIAAARELAREMTEGCPVLTRGTVKKGETMAGLLEKSAAGETGHFITAARKIFPLQKFRAGQPYAIATDGGRLQRFEYEIDSNTCLVIEGCDLPKARIEKIPYEIRLALVQTEIDDNLFQAVDDIGENPLLAVKLVDLFRSEINFTRNIRPGDRFAALVEKKYREGKYKGYGRIVAASFTNRGKVFEAFLFNDGNAKPQYYNRKGENLKKTLLQAPLAVTRVTSRFSHNRKHPILGETRPHLGVDYGAPHGTPVKAVGEGTVTFRGRAGGYGNQIILQHSPGLESMYAHLSGFAKGVREGAYVSQGQVIGYVGSTGLATGPHLDFRLKQNGKFINPAGAINPRGASVPEGKKKSFSQTVERDLAWMGGKRSLAEYRAEDAVDKTSTKNMTKKRELAKHKKPVSKRRQAARNNAKKRRS